MNWHRITWLALLSLAASPALGVQAAAHASYLCIHTGFGDEMAFKEISAPDSEGTVCELWMLPKDASPILLESYDGTSELFACSNRLNSTIRQWEQGGFSCKAASVPIPPESEIDR